MPSSSQLISALAGLRGAVGVGAYAIPNVSGKLFGLDPAGNPQASYLARLFGARDIALGVGAATTTGATRRSWLQLGLLCDAMDVGASYLAGRNGTLPKHAALMTGVTAAVAVGLGAAALASETA